MSDYGTPGKVIRNLGIKKYAFWIATVIMMLAISFFELVYTIYGEEALLSDIQVAMLLCTHMCFFSVFQLFSGVLIDYYGGRKLIPLAAFSVFIGMVLQIYTDNLNFRLMMIVSQIFLTFGASFSFIGIEYLSRRIFADGKAEIAFGSSQAVYSVLYVVFWSIATRYGLFLQHNFLYLTWSIALLQLTVFFVTICTSNIPEACGSSCENVKHTKVIRHIYDVIARRSVWQISLMGGLMFGIFFSLASLFLYKLNPSVGGITSMYVWIGFALGSPSACWIFSRFKGNKQIYWGYGFIQCCSLFLLILLSQGRESWEHTWWLSSINILMAMLFGGASGGHMIAFIMSKYVVEEGKRSTYCAIVNGFMCVFAGVIVLAGTFLAEFCNIGALLAFGTLSVIALYDRLSAHVTYDYEL